MDSSGKNHTNGNILDDQNKNRSKGRSFPVNNLSAVDTEMDLLEKESKMCSNVKRSASENNLNDHTCDMKDSRLSLPEDCKRQSQSRIPTDRHVSEHSECRVISSLSQYSNSNKRINDESHDLSNESHSVSTRSKRVFYYDIEPPIEALSGIFQRSDTQPKRGFVSRMLHHIPLMFRKSKAKEKEKKQEKEQQQKRRLQCLLSEMNYFKVFPSK